MPDHVFNLYPITNQQELSISYRLVNVEGELGLGSDNPDLAVKNLNLLATKLAFGQKLPVAIINGGEHPLLAVAADRPMTSCQYQLTPHVATLRPRDEIHVVEFPNLDTSTLGIALSFLGWELRGHLYNHGGLWQASPNTFFQKAPVNASDRGRHIDTYGGFSPRFLFVDDRLHVAVPVIYSYTDCRWADDAFDDREIRKLGGRKMLYHFGNRQFPIKFQRRTGKSIREQDFIAEGGDGVAYVYEWTVRKVGDSSAGRLLNPDSPAIRYKNLGNEQERFGALSLCKLMLNNEDPRVASSKREHQRTPTQRIEASTGVVNRFLAGIRLGVVELKIDSKPRKTIGKRFGYPPIQFGKGTILRIGDNRRNGEISLRDLPNKRTELLEDDRVGFAVLSELDDQVLVAPRSLGIAVVEDLKNRIEGMVSQLIRKPYALQLVRYHDEDRRTLNAQVNSVFHALDQNDVNGGRGVLVLPPRSQPDLHNYLKKKLRDRVQFQCMAAEKIKGFYGIVRDGQDHAEPRPERRFHSYLLNTVMGLMIVNRQWPWVLHQATNYDAYIGLDVLNHTAALTFFYEGGRVCAMRDHASSNKERLSQRVVAKLVCDGLRQDLADLDEPPRSLVLRRDGRLFESEWLGFRAAVLTLVDEGLLPRDILLGAVEVPKHHSYGVRLVERFNGALQNPVVGSWEKLSESEGLVCSTGWPFNIPGTVEPLVLRVARGNLDIVRVLGDTFDMSQLCWPTPRGCMRLSIDLKLCDEHLRAFAAWADEDRAVFGESVETEEEPLLAAAS
jgi:hypothetical protein